MTRYRCFLSKHKFMKKTIWLSEHLPPCPILSIYFYEKFLFYQKWSCRQEPHWVSQNQILLKVLKMLLWTLLLHLTWTIMSKLPATNAKPCPVQWLLHCAGTRISLRPKWVWGWPTVYTYPFHTKLYNNLKRVGLAYLTLYQSISFEILSHFDVLDFLPLRGQSVGY